MQDSEKRAKPIPIPTPILVKKGEKSSCDQIQIQRKLCRFLPCTAVLGFPAFVTALVLFPMVNIDQKPNCKHILYGNQPLANRVPGSTCQSILNTAKCTFPEDKIWKAPEKCRTGGWKLGGSPSTHQ